MPIFKHTSDIKRTAQMETFPSLWPLNWSPVSSQAATLLLEIPNVIFPWLTFHSISLLNFFNTKLYVTLPGYVVGIFPFRRLTNPQGVVNPHMGTLVFPRSLYHTPALSFRVAYLMPRSVLKLLNTDVLVAIRNHFKLPAVVMSNSIYPPHVENCSPALLP